MSEFEFSSLGLVGAVLVGLCGYSYLQVIRVKRRQAARHLAYQREMEALQSSHALVFEDEDDGYTDDAKTSKPFVGAPATHSVQSVETKAALLEYPKNLAMQSALLSRRAVVADIRRDEHIEVAIKSPASPLDTYAHVETVNRVVTNEVPSSQTDAIELDKQMNIAEPIIEHTPESTFENTHQVISEEPDTVPIAHATPEINVPFATPSGKISSVNPLTSGAAVIEPMAEPFAETVVPIAPADPQFFTTQDLTEQSTLLVFEPLIRFSTWLEVNQPAPIMGIDGELDLTMSQPKNTHDIERALDGLRLNTDLPLRVLGLRAGYIATQNRAEPLSWQPLEAGALYSSLRLTLQLANASTCVNESLIQDWIDLTKRFAKRLSATVVNIPVPAHLAEYALYLHQVAQRLSAPLVVQLHKITNLWAGYEVHQNMTQWGLHIDEMGQYVARDDGGCELYRVVNDLTNPRAQDFYQKGILVSHTQTLSFCIDIARTSAKLEAPERMWQDMANIATALDAQWWNAKNEVISPEALIAFARVHINDYVEKIAAFGIPAGSTTMKRLLQR